MRGEHIAGELRPWYFEGSSPHARGASARHRDTHRPDRIIPACAGSIPGSGRPGRNIPDHPRMRGEHPAAFVLGFCETGSSPHARGAWVELTRPAPALGIIPACAGSIATRTVAGPGSPDHPRMRGEHRVTAGTLGYLRGSSPHARGAYEPDGWSSVGSGIIPACAGSIRPGSSTGRCCSDHPRMRGEHFGRSFDGIDYRGSSPHARGAWSGCSSRTRPERIIPACAGSISRTCMGSRSCRDHPRMRGEHTS